MNMKKIFLIALMIPCLASASNWWLVAKSRDGDVYFIDTQSAQRSGDSVNFWQKRNFPARDEIGNLSSKINLTINCRTREIIPRHFISYDAIDNQGKLTDSFDAPASMTWAPIAPDTVNEAQMQFVCKR